MRGARDIAAGDWLPAGELARRVFGVTPQQFNRLVRPVVPAAGYRSEGRGKQARRVYHVPTVIRAWRDAAVEKAAAANADPEAMLLEGPSTPALERLRLAKAQLAELELAAKRQQLVPVEEVRSGLLGPFAGALRRAGEVLGRNYGPGAQQVLDDALEAGRALLGAESEQLAVGREHGAGEPECGSTPKSGPKSRSARKAKTKSRQDAGGTGSKNARARKGKSK